MRRRINKNTKKKNNKKKRLLAELSIRARPTELPCSNQVSPIFFIAHSYTADVLDLFRVQSDSNYLNRKLS